MRGVKRYVWGLAAILLMAGARAYAAARDASAVSIAGIYALAGMNEPVRKEVLANKNVDGVALRYWWGDVEPSEGSYNWRRIDSAIAEARGHGKKVSLAVAAGIGTPPWVYADGVVPFVFRWTKPWGPLLCSEQRIPVPWDPVYLSKWRAFVRQLGLRYDSNPTVVLVKFTGLNGATAESSLPHEKGKVIARRGGSCAGSDDRAEWRQLGYSSEKVAAAWKQIADTFAQSFPHKPFAMMIGPGDLPRIDGHARGRRTGSPARGPLSAELLDQGIADYDGRFVVQSNSLSGVWSWKAVASMATRASTGYQMLWRVTGDRNCRMNRRVTPCDPHAVLEAAVNRGIDAGALYLEIYAADILNPNLQDILAGAHQKLSSR